MGNDVLLSAVTKYTVFAGINPSVSFKAHYLNGMQLLFLHSRLNTITKHLIFLAKPGITSSFSADQNVLPNSAVIDRSQSPLMLDHIYHHSSLFQTTTSCDR